jgi:hypothetical protein
MGSGGSVQIVLLIVAALIGFGVYSVAAPLIPEIDETLKIGMGVLVALSLFMAFRTLVKSNN